MKLLEDTWYEHVQTGELVKLTKSLEGSHWAVYVEKDKDITVMTSNQIYNNYKMCESEIECTVHHWDKCPYCWGKMDTLFNTTRYCTVCGKDEPNEVQIQREQKRKNRQQR